MKIGACDSLDEFIETFPMRPPVLLMVENDPEVMDCEYWIDLYRKTKADAVTLAAGGYIAYYPSKIPHHYRSKFLKPGQDLFGDLVQACRGMGMKYVFARTDSHVAHQEIRDVHPEWIAAGPDGSLLRHWAYPEAWLTCALGSYNFEFMNEVNKEIVRDYDIDFIFCNRWNGQSACWCESCKRMFRAASGRDIPLDMKNDTEPGVVAYRRWRDQRLLDLIDFWNKEITAIKPGARFIANAGGGALSDIDMLELAERSPFLIADRQSRPENGCHWMNGKNAKEFRATMGRKPVLAGINVGICGDHRWMDSTKDINELKLWHAEAIIHGMIPRFTKHSGVVYNKRWVDPVVELFGWLAENETALRNLHPIADVSLVYSQQTGRYYGKGEGQRKVEDHILGFYQAMVESRVPFEMSHDHLLDATRLSKFRTLVLPNVAALSDAQCERIRAFVRSGGNLVATYETSLYDEKGIRRPDFGLADLFGVSAAGPAEGPIDNSYLNVEPNPDGSWHPIVHGLEDHGRIINGVYRVPVKESAAFDSRPLTLVPRYPDLPMEELYPRFPRTDECQVFARQIPGGGRVVYFPWDVDRSFWELLHEPFLRLISNAIAWANGAPQPAVVSGPGVLDVAVWRQKTSMSVNIVNLTNPMMMRGAYREIIPVGEQRVVARLPQGVPASAVAGVRLLRSGKTVDWEANGGKVVFSIPGIEIFEIALIEFTEIRP